MPWVESVSPSFRARHDSAHADDADRVLQSLERTRERLAELFPRTVGEHHGRAAPLSPLSLSLSNPLLPLTWLATAPAARRYVAGWAGAGELHVLAPDALDAARVERPRLARDARAHRRLRCTRRRRDRREQPRTCPANAHAGPAALELRWAWLLEGAARWFSGQTEHARPAIARRLREGGRPSFPPACATPPCSAGPCSTCSRARRASARPRASSRRLHPQGARAALSARRSADARSCTPRGPGAPTWTGSRARGRGPAGISPR